MIVINDCCLMSKKLIFLAIKVAICIYINMYIYVIYYKKKDFLKIL